MIFVELLKIAGVLWLVGVTALAVVSLRLLGASAGWRYFKAQLVSVFIATPAGWVVLILPCLLHAWSRMVLVRSLKPLPGRESVDFWTWGCLGWASNPEDGVSGKQALLNDGEHYTPYMPCPSWITWRWAVWLWDSLRAYFWSAWRNSADELKYVYAWPEGHCVSGTWLNGRQYVIGWRPENGFNVPVLDL